MQSCPLGQAPIIKGDKFSKSKGPKNDFENEPIEQISYASAAANLI